MARNIEQYQVYSRMLEMSTKQSATHEESRRTSSIGNTLKTMVEN